MKLKLTRQELNRYRREVDDAATLAHDYFDFAIATYEAQNPDATVAEERQFVVDLVRTALPNFTEMGAVAACDFFDEMREACEWPGNVESQMYDMTDYDLVEEKIHYFAGELAAGNRKAFRDDVTDVTRYMVKRAAFDNMYENCRGQDIKYARVPSGFETCAFCFMLASRGFVYANERTAGKGHSYHIHCDCMIVPGFEGEDGNPRVKIDGYDPQVMYENWCKCAKTVGIDPLSASEEKQKAIMAEVKTRDWHWLYTGESPKYRILDGAKPSDEEKKTANRLAKSGYRSVFRPTRSKESRRTSDVFFDNGVQKTPWEFKNPKGDGKQTVSHQFEEAAGQSRNLVIDSHFLGDSWTDERLIEEAEQKLNRKKGFKVERGQDKGETWFFNQVIVVLRDESTMKLRRG